MFGLMFVKIDSIPCPLVKKKKKSSEEGIKDEGRIYICTQE